MPAVYDDEKEKLGAKTDHDGSHDDLGVHPERREAEAQDLENLYNAESVPELGSSSKAEDGEKSRLNDRVSTAGGADGGWKDSTSASGRGKGSRKRGAIAGVLVTVAVGAGGLGFLAAPNMIVNHLRELLMGKVAELQTHQARRYRRTKFNKAMDRFSRDGRKAGPIIAELEARGYRVDVDPADKNRIRGLTPPGSNQTRININDDIALEIEEFMDRRHPFRSARWKTKRMDAFHNRYGIPRVSPVRRAAMVVDDIEVEVNKRMAGKLLSDDTGDTRVTAGDAPDGGESDAESAARERRNKALDDVGKSDGSLDDIKKRLRDGESLSKFTPEDIRIMRIGLDDLDQELVDILNNFGRTGIGAKAVGVVKTMGMSIAADLADRVCTIKARLRAIIFAGRVWRARSLMQYAGLFIAASDETRTGNVDAAAMNELMKRVAAIDSTGKPIGASPAFKHMLNGTFSKSHNEPYKGNFGVDGSLTGIPGAIHSVTNQIPGVTEGQCSVWQNPATQIGASVLELGITIFTGGTGRLVGAGGKTAITTAFNAAIKNVISRQTLKSLATYAVIDLSFEGAMAFISMYTERSLAVPFTGQEKGGELGYILASGAGTMHKQRNLEAGMVPATAEQYAQAQMEYIAWKEEQNKNKSLYARVFDYNDTSSLVFNMATVAATAPNTPEGIGSSVSSRLSGAASLLLANPASLLASFSQTLTGRTYAQSTGDEVSFDTHEVEVGGEKVKLATDPVGNLQPIMRTDIEAIDPEENIEYLISRDEIDSVSLEPKGKFAEHYKNCVENIDQYEFLENGDPADPAHDCLARQRITVKYKAHLAYLDVLDGMEAFALPGEIASASGSNSGGGTADPATDNLNDPSFARNPNVKVDGSPPGPHRASNCTGTFTVGAASLKAVIEEKWRPPVTSIGGYACRKNTASEGTSIHGLGRALDVMIDGTTPEGLAKGNEIRNWVINNATQLGVQRVIWNERTWSADRDGWREYTGPNPHIDHLHIEINLEASMKENLGR